PADHSEAQDVGLVAERGEPAQRRRLHVPGWADEEDRIPGRGQLLQARRAEEHVERDVHRPGHVALFVFVRGPDINHAILALPRPDALGYLGGRDDAGHSFGAQEEVREVLAGIGTARWSACRRTGL